MTNGSNSKSNGVGGQIQHTFQLFKGEMKFYSILDFSGFTPVTTI